MEEIWAEGWVPLEDRRSPKSKEFFTEGGIRLIPAAKTTPELF
jgi:hypothetical protein